MFLDPFQLLLILGAVAVILVVIPTILIWAIKMTRASAKLAVREELDRREKEQRT